MGDNVGCRFGLDGDLAWLDIVLVFMFHWVRDLAGLGGDGHFDGLGWYFGWVGDSVLFNILVGLDI